MDVLTARAFRLSQIERRFFQFLPANNANKREQELRMAEIIYKDESFKIVGACFKVYKKNGFGFTEPTY